MGVEPLLAPLAPLYGAVVRARAAAYRGGLLRSHRANVPVVSVGNLTFGGTGKTPTVVALVKDLLHRGRRPAVLTRGYRRERSGALVLVGPDPDHGPEAAGDEPLEIAGRLPDVAIVVDANRVRGARRAVALGADAVVLDDGFQHLRLARDLDLVLLDAGDPFGGGRLPPRGRLREPVTALRRASAVLVTKLGVDHGERLAAITDAVRAVAPGLPVLASRVEPRAARTPEGAVAVEQLRGRRVALFAALGRPEGFADTVGETGAEIVSKRWFPDHHRYTEDDLTSVVAEADREGAVPLTTGKDAVKLPPGAPVWSLEVAVVPHGGSWEPLWELAPEAAL